MKRKIRVGILFGGKSAEHEVSIMSARNVAAALDTSIYEPVLIGINKHGLWLPPATLKAFLSSGRALKTTALIPKKYSYPSELQKTVDVVFPILHGPYGEDGTVQGFLKLANVPFVGAGVLGSAVGMDKDVMKRLLRDARVPVAKDIVVHSGEKISFKKPVNELRLPFFIKPANMGSSIGTSKVRNEKEFKDALREAFRFDTKILIEEFIKGRQIECAVLGNEKPIVSVLGEIVVHHDFYSYEAKYLDPNGASLKIPAKLPKNVARKIQELAIQTFKTLCCEGMGRVDFFVTYSGRIYVNEINTIPGFTNISMYPKLWEASSISYSKLLDKLIGLAIERFKKQQKLRTSI